MKHAFLAHRIASAPWAEALYRCLGPTEARQLGQLLPEDLTAVFDEVMGVPVGGTVHERFGVSSPQAFWLYYTGAWCVLWEELELPRGSTVLEVAAGDTTYVPEALAVYGGGCGRYVTANLNQDLTRGFLQKTKALALDVEVVEDNADQIDRYFAPGTFSLAAFQHAVNDLIQTIAAERHGIDTTTNSWWSVLPSMVRLVMDYSAAGRLGAVIAPALIRVLRPVADVVAEGGYLVFNNCVFQMDLDAGYSRDLYMSLIPLTRRWIEESDLPLQIVEADWLDDQWWLVAQKKG